eukprot:GHUV01027099.1.p1 GENE.GHUV01027099.1~~GHUV01027099.1.p1  ORF type:complete len:165 (+),score=33.04 GHUV01027099.1:186-680(+)
MQNLRSRGQLHAGWGTPACRAPVSIPARIAVAARPPTRVHALPVGDVAHDLHAHIQTAFDLADAAAAAASSSSSSDGGFLAPVSNSLETVLKTIQEQLDRFHVPYSYGYSILILTAIVKLVTLPLTKKQVRLEHSRISGTNVPPPLADSFVQRNVHSGLSAATL